MTSLPKPIREKTLSTYQQIINVGIEQGLEQGIEQGIEQGLEQGIEQGEIKTKREAVKNMLVAKVSDTDIMKYLNVTQDFIDEVRKSMES